MVGSCAHMWLSYGRKILDSVFKTKTICDVCRNVEMKNEGILINV